MPNAGDWIAIDRKTTICSAGRYRLIWALKVRLSKAE